MKATGIVRRIDDLGRIVIPKEIRRTLHIRESDPLEIFTDREGQVILKKYSPIGEMTTFAKQYAETLEQVSGHATLIAINGYSELEIIMKKYPNAILTLNSAFYYYGLTDTIPDHYYVATPKSNRKIEDVRVKL